MSLFSSDADMRVRAAKHAVDGIPARIEKSGIKPAQARAMSQALQCLVIADSYERDAEELLRKAGFDSETIHNILTAMREGLV